VAKLNLKKVLAMLYKTDTHQLGKNVAWRLLSFYYFNGAYFLYVDSL
jgi:hypothetical protein